MCGAAIGDLATSVLHPGEVDWGSLERYDDALRMSLCRKTGEARL
jgi:hypothetical protein